MATARRSIENLTTDTQASTTTASHIAMSSGEDSNLQAAPIDLNEDIDIVRAKIKERLLQPDTINPFFRVRVSGLFSQAQVDCLRKVREFYKLETAYAGKEGPESCVSCPLEPAWECTNQLRAAFFSVTSRITEAMFGDKFENMLEEESKIADANLIIRYYPKSGPRKLGAHVDGNFITVLWSDRPGLQFPSQTKSGLTPSDVRAIGLPSLAPPMIALSDDMWDDVPQDENTLVVSLGNGFYEEKVVKESEFAQVNCPVLHRVSCSGDYDRYSIPFLFRVDKKEEE